MANMMIEAGAKTGFVHPDGLELPYAFTPILTDTIIQGKYTKTMELQTFGDHVLEDLDPEFKTKVQAGNILVAGENFGCGSSREQAPLALKVAGVSAVVARYFARIFYRNAVNIGLPALEIREHDIEAGDELEIVLKDGTVKNLTKKNSIPRARCPRR